MIFSATFLGAIVYVALAWCALAALGLSAVLLRDLVNGDVW